MAPHAEAIGTQTESNVLTRLESVCATRGLPALADRLADLAQLVTMEMAEIEAALDAIPRGRSVVHATGHHLLDLRGKLLRPLCVILAARVGSGVSPAVRDLAVAVELVHAATLLHDDVVDMGERRRGMATARTVYGNAASIFAGDWLLVEALKRVRHTGCIEALDRLLETIESMIFAESIQLENRGRFHVSTKSWLDVVEGKTAALFRWAMWAGAKASGLSDASASCLEDYGRHLGVAFQAVDDVLDLVGEQSITGKQLFADLQEGKMTYPVIVALERSPELHEAVIKIAGSEQQENFESAKTTILHALEQTKAIETCIDMARERVAFAKEAIRSVPDSAVKTALVTVAETAVSRHS